tara:strand:+ start:1701 stop:1898 length:198 start_codon:yes stop_codon:yes gene_type:complete
MNSKELGFVFIFIAAFGLSDFFVKQMKFKKMSFIFYYIFIGSLGLGIMYNVFKIGPNSNKLFGRI